MRFKVEESRTSARPFPCKNCLKYHAEKVCTSEASCFKCGDPHPSYTCKVIPNKNFCGTCQMKGHRTAASNCPLRPRMGHPDTSEKIYCPLETTNSYADMLQIKENEPTSNNKDLTDLQKIEESLTTMIKECMDTLTKWVSTVLAFALPTDSTDKLQTAVNRASEELLLCRLNILKSVDSHVYIGKEPFQKKQKLNKDKDKYPTQTTKAT